MGFRAAITLIILFTVSQGHSDESSEAYALSQKILNPKFYLKEVGPLVVMGNSPLESAKIVFLPEVHDDPNSLLAQFLLIALEKKKGKSFVVLDESLGSMEKSIWDIFSQKALEILAAKDQRREKVNYAPHLFENVLQRLANKFRASPGQLNYLSNLGIWSLANFDQNALPFYGWDIKGDGTLVDRNIKMVETLQKVSKNNDRVIVMAGARHVPDLEYVTSQQLLCPQSRFADKEKFFSAVESRYGNRPHLQHGIGATLPIQSYLSKQKYAVVFNKSLYNELDSVIRQFKGSRGDTCLRLW